MIKQKIDILRGFTFTSCSSGQLHQPKSNFEHAARTKLVADGPRTAVIERASDQQTILSTYIFAGGRGSLHATVLLPLLTALVSAFAWFWL